MKYKPNWYKSHRFIGQDRLNKQALEYLLACGKLDKDGKSLVNTALERIPYGATVNRRKDPATGRYRFIEIVILSDHLQRRFRKVVRHGSFTIPHWDFNDQAEEICSGG